MDSTKSRIQWTKYEDRWDDSLTLRGKIQIPGFDLYLDACWLDGIWHWAIRSSSTSKNIISSRRQYKITQEAQTHGAIFMMVALLIKLEPNMFKEIRSVDYTIAGF